MKAYVICIVSTYIINLFAENLLKRKRKHVGLFLLALSLFIFAFVAGVRDIYVGTDVRSYVVRLANLSVEKDFISYVLSPDSHALFGILVYVGYIFRNINFLLFFIEVAVCLPIYIYAYKVRNTLSLSLIITIFALTMYCTSYNLIRQSIAISQLILSYYYYSIDSKVKSYLLIGLASLFHITGLVFLTVFFMNEIVKKKSNKKYLYLFICFIGAAVFSIFAEYFISLTSFDYYVGNVKYMREFSISSIAKQAFWVILAVITFYFVIKNKKKNISGSVDSELCIYLFLFSTFFTLMSFSIPGMGRLGYYFYDLAIILVLPILRTKIKPRLVGTTLILILMFYLWWHMTCVPNDSAGVYPYESTIVQFLN